MTAAKIGERLQGKKAASPHRIARNSETVWGDARESGDGAQGAARGGIYRCDGRYGEKDGQRAGRIQSTVHKDMESRLARLSAPLHREVAAVMAKNKAERHLRGGEATKRRYAKTEA